MAILPTTIPTPMETAVASYSYTDIAEGTGVVKYYGFTSVNDTTKSYHLGGNVVYSQDFYLGGISTGTSFVKAADIDFDLTPFNLTKSIKGTALINVTHASVSPAAGGAIVSYLIAKIRKYSGTTETDLVSTQSQTLTNGGGANEIYPRMNCLKLTIPRTHFKKGDILRLTIEGWVKRTGGNEGYVYFGCDPKNRDSAVIIPSTDDPPTTTMLELYVPFEILK